MIWSLSNECKSLFAHPKSSTDWNIKSERQNEHDRLKTVYHIENHLLIIASLTVVFHRILH